MAVYVRFERGRDGVVGPTYGPYDFVQITYDLLRASLHGEETELAIVTDEGEWLLTDAERPDRAFSNVIIASN